MPRIKFINLKLASAAKGVVANTTGHQGGKELGTGPERLAPWWPLLEQVLAAASAQDQPQPGTGADESDCQTVQLPLETNLDHLDALEWDNAQANVQASIQADANASWICPPPPEYQTPVIVHRAPAFPSRIIENGVFPPLQSKQPKNWKTLERLIRYAPVGLQYPSEEEYRCWLRRTAADPNPETLIWEISSLIDRYPTEKHYLTAIRKMIDNVPPTAAYNAGLLAPQPDFLQGIDMPGFGDVRVEHIPGAVLFERTDDSITLAHVAGEFFGATSNEERFAEMCSSHAGAALVFGRNNALKHARRPDKPGHAHVLTFITNASNITFYAHHATQATGQDGEEKLEYHQYPLLTTNLRDSYENFKKGWAQLRNCQQFAFEKSHELRDLLEKQHLAHGAACWALQGKGGPRSPIKASQLLQPRPLLPPRPPRPPKARRGKRATTTHGEDQADQGQGNGGKGSGGGEDCDDDRHNGTVIRSKVAPKRRTKRKMDNRVSRLTADHGEDQEEAGSGKGEEGDKDGQRPAVKKQKKRC